jgi:hypothetical protein
VPFKQSQAHHNTSILSPRDLVDCTMPPKARFEPKVPIPPKSELKSPVIPIVPSVVPTQVPPEMQQTPSLGSTRDGPLSPPISITTQHVSPVSSIEEDIPLLANPMPFIPPTRSRVELFMMIEALDTQFAESIALQSEKNDVLFNKMEILQETIDQFHVSQAHILDQFHSSHATLHDEILHINDSFENKFDELTDFLKKNHYGAKSTESLRDDVSSSKNSHLSDAEIPKLTPIIPSSIPIPITPLPFTKTNYFDPDDAPLFADQHNSIMPRVRDANLSITRSIAPIDPSSSQVKLTELTAKAVFIWGENMQMEQQKAPYEVLSWARYINRKITFHIQAMNNALGLCNTIHLQGYIIILSNDQLWDVIVQLVRPQSTPEWVKTFNSMVRFTQVPQTYILDITKYDFLYSAMIEFEFLINRVIRFLDFKAVEKFTPALKSNPGKVGLMELIYSKMPGNLGIKLHNGISDSQLKNITIQEYLSFIMMQNQALYEDSRRTKVNRLKYEGSSPLTPEGDVNQKITSPSGKYPYDVKLNYLNNLSPPHNAYMNPYSPTEKSDLPHQFHQFNIPEDTNRYNPITDEKVSEFDYFDAYTDKANVENYSLNPMYNNENLNSDHLQDPDEDLDQVGTDQFDSLHKIDISRMRTLPCFNAMMGVCSSPTCSYSHDRNLLSAAFERKMAEMRASPFAKNPTATPIFNTRKSINSPSTPTFQPRRLEDPRRSTVNTPSPFSPPPRQPTTRSLYEINSFMNPPPPDESDRIHRSGNRFASSSPLPVSSDKVSDNNPNVI